MRLTVVAIALGLVALTSGAYYPPSKPVTGVKYADKDFLYKQKFFFEVLRNIHLPLQFQEYLPYTKSYIADSSKYVNFEEVTEFFNYYKAGFLGKGELFSIYNKEYMTQTYLLFNFFYNSIDFDTFYKNVVFARENVNEGIFIHALTLAVFHHPELKGFVLPAIYEIYPYYFFNTDVIHSVTFRKQYDQKFGFASNGKYNVVYDNYTATYPIDYYGEEKLAYFTEDIGLNAYYYYFMMDYPYFLGTDKYNFSKDRRGELYLYMYQQLIARYYLERQANFLGPIEEFDYDFPLKTGYWSKLSYYNGIPFFVRNDYYSFSKDFYYQVTLLKDYEQRFRQVIDKGYYYLEDGSKIDLRQPESVEYLGNMMFSNPDSVDNYYFGFFEMIARQVYSGGAKFYKYIPSALMHFETSLRDPFFYQLYNRFLTFYYKFKSYLNPYTYEELYFKGVEIKSVAFEKLMTYFEYFDAEVSNVVPIKASGEKFFDFSVFARQKRINHKPFSYTMDVYSEFAGKGVVRVYMGPKFYDFKELQYVKKYFVEVDQYQYDFVTGKNTIVRNSRDFYYSVRDRTTYTELYKKIMTAYSGGEKFVLDNSEAHCGFPDRLLLPKGLPSGYEMTFYFIVTPYYAPKVPQFSTYDNTYQCGVGSGSKYIDDLPFGYPFDRDIDFSYFYTKNMYFKDVFIYHSEEIKPYVPYHAVEDMPYVPYQV